MNEQACRYQFEPKIPPRDIEETLQLAVLAAECLHGEARVRLDTSYSIDKDKHVYVVDASSDVGRDILRIFTGFATREFGEHAFSVHRVEHAPAQPR
ncbi:MAG: hypothetical protein HQ592_07375 [Planctomycetes bacterium]|nr:hypothetical protein [Planctomycetota bacterium]